MFKTEKNQNLDCIVYYKPVGEVLSTTIPSEELKEIKVSHKISTLFNSNYRERLERLFTYKIKDSTDKKNVWNFITDNHTLSDKEIYEALQKIIPNIISQNNRGNYRINSIKKYIHNWDKISPTFYLDIGCFQGDITETVGKHFNLNKFQIRGIDIKKYVENENYTFTEYNGKDIPFNDESFDLITCFMILHHIPEENLIILLNEIYRVMIPGGILIIREHNAENNDYLLLDTLHEFYDYVLNPLHVWNECHANYHSFSDLKKKILNAGFKSHSLPVLRGNNLENPFNNYIASFRKPKNPIVIKKFFRILTPDFAKEEYKSNTLCKRNSIHWGQRKLLLSEIELLCIYFERFPQSVITNLIVIYAGAAPGTHIKILHELFPEIEFVLFDPSTFDRSLRNISKITLHQQLFTDEICAQLKEEHNDRDIIFISDVRTADTSSMISEDVEKNVANDQKMQMEWYYILNPKLSMFKFRLPWDDKKILYLKGDIYLQAYAPLTSTETRLIIEKDAPVVEYDNKSYEEQLFYFNRYLRESYYVVDEDFNKPLLYDFAVEFYVYKKFISLNKIRQFCNHDLNCLKQFSDYIDYTLSRNRTLSSIQPLSNNKKEIVKKLLSDGLVPHDINYTVEDYKLYVMPIINRI